MTRQPMTSGVSHLPALTDQERFSLELRWYEGRMLPYIDWLLDFAERNRDDILSAAGAEADARALLAETKRRITQVGSLHLVAELRDQRREIENALWYGGEHGEHDRATIQLQWCARHAEAWRRWRIQEYLFVADRCEHLVIEVLAAPVFRVEGTRACRASRL